LVKKILQQLAGLRPPQADLDYRCLEDYVLRHGREFDPGFPTVNQLAVFFAHVDRLGLRFPIKSCFASCQQFVLLTLDPRFVYVEGYVSTMGLPIQHAWLLVDNQLVFDPVLRRRGHRRAHRLGDRALGHWLADEREYMGVVFPDTEVIRSRVVETREYGPVIDDWQRGWPLLRRDNGLPRESDPVARGHGV
jgi:hypothetical protein